MPYRLHVTAEPENARATAARRDQTTSHAAAAAPIAFNCT
jgi:hypothetical protein